MTSETIRLGRAAVLSLSASMAILLMTVLCVLLQGVAPTDEGPVFVLFPYNGEVVGIGLTGGLLPLLLSFLLVAFLTWPSGNADAPTPFASLGYWLGVAALGVIITVFFSASHALYGGLGLSKLWAFWLVIAGGVAGVDYWWLRGRRLGLVGGTAECYVLGTMGVLVSDVIRTLSGLARAPGEAAVWGGGGLLDILFWLGLYVAISFLCFRGLLGAFTRVSRTFDAAQS